MTLIVTTDFDLNKVAAPNLPLAPIQYESRYQEQLNNVLRLYFNRLDNFLGQLMASVDTLPISFPPTSLDAFGRLQVAEPYTIFDSQNRYAADNQFDTSTATGGTTTYNSNQASVSLNVTTTSGSSVVRQTYRVMPYQPGKGLEAMMTFTMNAGKAGLRQRVGYFNTQNGVFLQYDGTTLSFVLRSNSIPTPGTPSDVRTVNQADWNGDKLDGTGASGIVLDVTKTQILYFDFEWLGVGQVRCGFFQDGQFIICHTFDNENVQDFVYMTTAILPIRYEITNTATTASSSTLQQICSTVISNGGYQQSSALHLARRTTTFTNIDTATNFYPIVSIRLASTALGAVVLPNNIQFQPTTLQNYEIALIKNPVLTGASWTAQPDDANVEYDVSATAIATAGTVVQQAYIANSGGGGQATTLLPQGFNWDLQVGSSLSGVSDIYTLGVRTISGATKGDGVGSISFYDLTQ